MYPSHNPSHNYIKGRLRTAHKVFETKVSRNVRLSSENDASSPSISFFTGGVSMSILFCLSCSVSDDVSTKDNSRQYMD